MVKKTEFVLAEFEKQRKFLELMMEFQTEAGKGTIKTALVINGGAAIALLAFVGNIFSNGPSNVEIEHLTDGFIFFSYGVLIAAVSALSFYISVYLNFHFGQISVDKGESLREMKVTYLKIIAIKPWLLMNVFELLTIVLIVVSFILFYFGVTNTVEAFSA